jgi:hypothetical protein
MHNTRMLTCTCHCGSIRIEVSEHPQSLIECNCSICRRNGALWALCDPGKVRIVGHPEHTSEYIWGANTIKTLRCSNCGCVTHWESLQPEPGGKLGVNMRNSDPMELQKIRIRQFDGAETWSYLDGQ